MVNVHYSWSKLQVQLVPVQLWASCSHTCSSVTTQYYLVLVKGLKSFEAGKVTMNLIESNGSIPPGFFTKISSKLNTHIK